MWRLERGPLDPIRLAQKAGLLRLDSTFLHVAWGFLCFDKSRIALCMLILIVASAASNIGVSIYSIPYENPSVRKGGEHGNTLNRLGEVVGGYRSEGRGFFILGVGHCQLS